MTDACHFLNRWLSLLPIPKMTGACHFFQIQKWQVAVIFVDKNDTYLSFFFTRQNRRWDPHVFRGGGSDPLSDIWNYPWAPHVFGRGAQVWLYLGHFRLISEPPLQKHGGLRGSYRCLKVGLSPPPKNMGGSAQGFGAWKKMTGICHFWISKNDSHLSFLDFKKMTGAWHFWILQKWQPPVTVWLLKKMTGACHLLIFCKKRRT